MQQTQLSARAHVSSTAATHREFAAANGGLVAPLLGVALILGLHRDALCHQEGGIEAHSEAPN